MITSSEAEKIATEKLREYVNSCGCRNIEDVGNVLMKLLSVTGLALVATQGQEKAVEIMQGTMLHIAKEKYSKPFNMEKLQ